MADRFANLSPSLNSPYVSADAITKSDSAVFDITRAIYVGGAGDVAVKMLDGTQVTFTAVPAGTVLRIRVSQILSSGTSASAFVALY